MRGPASVVAWAAGFTASREQGIGLAESLAAIAVMAATAVALVTALGAGSVSVRHADELATARGLATSQMEHIKSLLYDVAGAYEKLDAPTGYAIVLAVDSGIFADTDIQQVTVAIRKGGEDVLSLQGFKVNR